MKSKSFDLSHATAEKLKQDRKFDFVHLYKSASETNTSASERSTNTDHNDKESHASKSPKHETSHSKRKKKEKREPMDISQINIDGPVLESSLGGSTPLNVSQVTSTPLGNSKKSGKSSKVKSIMKNTTANMDDTMDDSKLDILMSKPKKRNKSVSFMLDENEAMIIKKTKSDDSSSDIRSDVASPKIKIEKVKRVFKKVKKHPHAEKENKVDEHQTTDVNIAMNKKTNKKIKSRPEILNNIGSPLESTVDSQSELNENIVESKKKIKRVKKTKHPIEPIEPVDIITIDSTSLNVPYKVKKIKKKKHQEIPDSEEPVLKMSKKDPKPDVIAADLKNLSIGDNAHTLSNLLDEMTVVDKVKRKKLKQKLNKNKKPKSTVNIEEPAKVEVGQEKVKWRRRKWNKDTKAEAKDASLETTVIVENLPLSMLFSYKKMLTDHFVKYGLIKNVGIAEVYATEESKPFFTTTINFYSDGAAVQALEEDNTTFEGSRIRVKRALPLTETTLVVRSYGTLTTQSLSSTFSSAGRIRNIRHLVKGKHAMATFFIEFDGPETVERAMKLTTNTKIGGKKIYVSKFETRVKKGKVQKTNDDEGSDADHSDECDESQDPQI